MESEKKLISEAINAFNYPEEMGESADESIEQLTRIKKTLRPDSRYHKIVSWMLTELSKSLDAEFGDGEISKYSLVRGSDENIEAYDYKLKTWVTIQIK